MQGMAGKHDMSASFVSASRGGRRAPGLLTLRKKNSRDAEGSMLYTFVRTLGL